MEAAVAKGRKPALALWDLQALGPAHADPLLCDFLENYILDERVKLIHMMCDTCLTLRLASPQARLDRPGIS